jgi:hypothetical protein
LAAFSPILNVYDVLLVTSNCPAAAHFLLATLTLPGDAAALPESSHAPCHTAREGVSRTPNT